MKILISGINGYLGSHLAKFFLNEGYEIYGLKRSASDLSRISNITESLILFDTDIVSIDEAVKKSQPDVIIHTACDYGRSGSGILSLLKTNLLYAVELLDCGARNNVKTFINTDSALPENINIYSLSKSQFKSWGYMFSNEIQFINMRIEHMYGENDDEHKFIGWFLGQLKREVETIPLTSGIQLRDFIYISDIVEAYALVIKKLEEIGKAENFDIASGRLTPVRDFLEMIMASYKEENAGVKTPNLLFGKIPFRENELMAADVSIEKMLEIGWRPKVSLKEGVSRIVKGE